MPACVKFGVQLNVAVPLPLSTNDAPAGRAEVEKAGTVPSGSAAVKPKLSKLFSVTVRLPMVASTGA